MKVGGERLLVLKHAQVSGYEVLKDADYDVMRGWAKAAKMPPYEEQ
ncbi:MAG: hypothetical protein HY900_26545 [Deltaproteobacteria bacterium]|nr:hypothetical protein [Deltaproteobacteria bacterium]